MPKINLGRRKKKRVYTASKKKAQEVYQDPRWKAIREEKLRQNPICERCEPYGRINFATEVHHLIPFSQGNTPEMVERLAFDIDNLESLCTYCHKMAHQKLN